MHMVSEDSVGVGISSEGGGRGGQQSHSSLWLFQNCNIPFRFSYLIKIVRLLRFCSQCISEAERMTLNATTL
jgi:hypothetical protein